MKVATNTLDHKALTSKLKSITSLNKYNTYTLKVTYLMSCFGCTTGAGVTFVDGATSSVGFVQWGKKDKKRRNKQRGTVNTIRTASLYYNTKE